MLQEAPAPELVPRRPFEGVPRATVTNVRALLWSGPLGVVMVFFGLFVMAGFFPPPIAKTVVASAAPTLFDLE